MLLEGGDVSVHVSGADLLRVSSVRILDDQAAGLEQHLDAGLALDLVERLVGVGGEGGVLRLVLGQTDDPGVVLRGAARVAELELLDSEDGSSQLAREPVQRGRAQAAAPDDYYLMVVQSYTPCQPCPDARLSRGRVLDLDPLGLWRSAPPFTVTSSRPFSKLALTLLASTFSGSFNLRLKRP